MTRLEIFNIMQQHKDYNINKKLEFIENFLLGSYDYSEKDIKEIKHNFSYLKSEFKRRWMTAHQKKHIFIKKYHNWLQGTFLMPKITKLPGRPSKIFKELSKRSKRRKTQELRTSNIDELTFATQVKLRTVGKRDAATVLNDISSSPNRANKYKKAYSRNLREEREQLSPLQALSMFTEAGLTRKQYEVIRHNNKKIYPCYSILQKAKLDCYPIKESYQVTDTCSEVNLQDLLAHTTTRLLSYLEQVIETLSDEESRTLTLTCKWGCDGSQQTRYKQKFENVCDSDANIFQSSFVPLQLTCDTNNKKIIWQNPTPSSPRYCRPIRIRFVKESVDITNEEVSYIQNAINSLQETKVTLAGKNFLVRYTMMLTMVDAKICNAITHTTSTMKCYICGETSKDFNRLEKIKEINQDSLNFGLSILHARIRLFESLLHLSYKLPIKKWQLRLESEKAIAKQRKLFIQEEFRNKMGLIVDVPTPGFGNTNDGNTSRRFFMNPDLAAEITGLDANLIHRLKVILETISSGHRIHTEKFAEFAMETAKLYVQLYSWYPMTPTMHKILVHGATVIEKALLPIGQLSEEASEARNKHFRSYRQRYSRKFSRESCNLDVLNRLLLSSDPLLAGMRLTHKKKTKPFMKETLQMLLPAEPNWNEEISENVSSDETELFSSDEESDISTSSICS